MNAAPALQMHPKLREIELRRVILLALGGLVMGGGMAAFGVWQAWEVYLDPNPLKVVYAAGGAFMAGLVGVGAWREQRVSLNRMALAESLAKDGELTIVSVLTSRRDDNGFRVMLRYTLRTPDGATHEASVAASEGGAYRVDELGNKSAALLSRDGRQVLLLTRSGYPLLNAAEALAHASATESSP
jgi:hypothetical protein